MEVKPYFRRDDWKGNLKLQRFSDGVDEEMKDDVDSVLSLLDRIKKEKEKALLQTTGSRPVQENGRIIPDLKENDVINELQKKQTSVVMNLKSVGKSKESRAMSGSSGSETAQSDSGDNSKKRKQNAFLVEVQERAEVISKSARKAPEAVVSSMGQNIEEDPDTEQFLKKIRAAPSVSSEKQQTGVIETREQRSKSASEVDLSVVVSTSSQLNLEPQKSKIPLGRSGSLKGRRKPTAAARRKSLKSGVTDDWDDTNAISEEDDSMEEDETGVGLSDGNFIIKDPPQMGAGGEVKPRTKPKPKVKSQTVAGIALPGLAQALSKKNLHKDDVRPQVSAAEIVRAAAENKKNQVLKEERVEKEPEKPAWLVEAEARRKLHEQRRHNRAKQHEEMDNDKTAESKLLNGVVLSPVTQRSERFTDKTENNGTNLLHNVMVRPVRKPDQVPTRSEDDSDVSRNALNVRLRSVPKQGISATDSDNDKENDSIKPHNVHLRPIPKPEPAVNNDSTEDMRGRFQPVRLKPIFYPTAPTTQRSQKVADSEVAPSLKSAGTLSAGPAVEASKVVPMAVRTSSEVTASSTSPIKPVTQSFSQTVTSSRVHVNDYASVHAAVEEAKSSPEYHVVRALSAITSEKRTMKRSEPKVVEASSRPRGGSIVTVSSNYVSAPQKVAPKKKPKPANRSKTVTVTASEVPDPLTARRKSVELVHAKVEGMGTWATSTAVSVGDPVSHNVKSHGDLWRARHGSDLRDRADTFDSAYRPSYTGEVLPKWKIDLIQRKKNVTTRPDRPQPTNTFNSVIVPQWKKELAERRKNRPETINGVQMSNKENEPKTSPEIPQWKKEIVERRKRRETSPIRVPDKIDRSPQTPEWKQRLSNNRRTQPIVIPRGPSEDSGDQIPSFMKEFEKKKRTFPRGGSNASYV